MKIWIDLANAPHVPFFLPIIEQLEQKGHEVVLSLRDFNYTVELAARNGCQGAVIGRHGGRNPFAKIVDLMSRTKGLIEFARDKRIDVAVSHNSYAQTVAGRLSGIRVVTIMDYEGQPANHIGFRFANKVIVPDSFPDEDLRRFGASVQKTYRYKGYKEQLYLSSFTKDPTFKRQLEEACDLPKSWDHEKTTLAIVRTPATMAAYHPKSNPTFERLLEGLDARDDLTVVMLCRTDQQREEIRERYSDFHIPKHPLDGNNLVYHADLVISAGGTMNREAAILGTPAYTVFAGALPAVDANLVKAGRLTRLETEQDLAKIEFVKKPQGNMLKNPNLCREIVHEILQ